MRIARTCLAVTALLALSACDKPKWREKPPATPDAAAAPAEVAATPGPPARVIPVDPAGTPPPPAWAKDLIGKPFRDVFPKNAICTGNNDIVQKTYAGAPAGVQLHGWGWHTAAKVRVPRVVLVDKAYMIVAAGEGGVPRPDVTAVLPAVTDKNTGWNADAPVVHGPLDAYGVLPDGSVCALGHLEF